MLMSQEVMRVPQRWSGRHRRGVLLVSDVDRATGRRPTAGLRQPGAALARSCDH
jgi:hypothetical protein